MGRKKTSYMFPHLHQDILTAVSGHITAPEFHRDDNDSAATNRYATHVMGTFKCNNKTCSRHGWSSKKVAILIRGYSKGRYNAVVFNQRCKSCNTLGNLELDKESYIDRVAYRLQKWAGIAVEKHHVAKKKGPPHESTLCEGCKRGICPKANDLANY